MTNYPVHTIESAPAGSQAALAALKHSLGIVPNLAATMASAPPLVNSFVAVFGQFRGGSFTPGERQALLLANAVANTCPWAVAFHSTLALHDGVAADDVDAIRRGASPAEVRIAALVALTRALIAKRGHLDEAELRGFVAAGFRHEQALEVIAGLAISVMANYTGNITNPPLEPAFQPQAWRY